MRTLAEIKKDMAALHEEYDAARIHDEIQSSGIAIGDVYEDAIGGRFKVVRFEYSNAMCCACAVGEVTKEDYLPVYSLKTEYKKIQADQCRDA